MDWLGDLGGLYDALVHTLRLLMGPISSFALNSAVLSSFFRFKERPPPPEGDDDMKLTARLTAKIGSDHSYAGLDGTAINLQALNDKNLPETMRQDFHATARIKHRNQFLVYFGFCCNERSRR